MRFVFPLIAACALVSCDSSPESDLQQSKNQSTATLEIVSRDDSFKDSDRHLANQIEILQSPNILDSAAKLSGVSKAEIAEALEVSRIDETDFLKLTASHDDGELAKKIATAVVEAYLSNGDTTLEEAFAAVLNRELELQGKAVVEGRDLLSRRLERHKELPTIRARVQEKVGEIFRAKSKIIADIEALEDHQPGTLGYIRTAAEIDVPSNLVIAQYRELLALQDDLQHQFDQGLGFSHPSVIELKNEGSQIKKEATKAAEEIHKVLQKKSALLGKQLEKSQAEEESLVKESRMESEYQDLVAQYESARIKLASTKSFREAVLRMIESARPRAIIHGWEHFDSE